MKKNDAIQTVPRGHLEKMAMNMRKKARNADMDRQRMGRRLMTAVVGAGSAFAMGMYVGSQAKAGKPTDYGGVDVELIAGGALAAGGIVLQGRPKLAKAGEFLEASGMGVLAYYAGSRGEQMGADAGARAVAA